MKALLTLLLAVHAVTAVTLFQYSLQENEQLLNEWDEFKERHGKSYSNAGEEYVRYAIYLSNKRLVEEHNSEYSQGKHRYSMKLNHFADMLHEEFVTTMNGYKQHLRVPGQGATHVRLPKEISIPKSIDWRKKGAVTPVKDQGQCGSCWAFSATGSLEGQHFRKTGKLVSLSEQNLVDCSSAFGNQGCNGGLMDNAFKYVKANHGIDTESSYPYDGADDPCRFKNGEVGATDVGFMDVQEGDEDALKEAVAVHGPVSVAIDASQPSFQFYHKGVYEDLNCSTTDLDHGVLVVGYGSETGKQQKRQDFWIVKNSWNEDWGDQGYIKMARNKNNACGIASGASFPLV